MVGGSRIQARSVARVNCWAIGWYILSWPLQKSSRWAVKVMAVMDIRMSHDQVKYHHKFINDTSPLCCLNWRMGFPGGTSGKELTCQCRRCKKCGFDAWVVKIPCRWKWQPTPVFLPGESHGQKSLAGYSASAHRESNMTAHTHSMAWWDWSLCP